MPCPVPWPALACALPCALACALCPCCILCWAGVPSLGRSAHMPIPPSSRIQAQLQGYALSVAVARDCTIGSANAYLTIQFVLTILITITDRGQAGTWGREGKAGGMCAY